MGLANIDYLYLKNTEHIGKASFEYRGDNGRLTPVLHIVNSERWKYRIESGFCNVDGIFFQCPIDIGYVQINKVNYEEKQRKERVSAELLIFPSNSNESHKILFNKEEFMGTSLNHGANLYAVINYINFINEYLNSGNDFKDLNVAKSQERIVKYNRRKLINIVDNLCVKFFSYGINRTGRDNCFYESCIISNLPDELYFKNILLRSLEFECKQRSIQRNKIVLEYPKTTGYSPSYDEVEIDIDGTRAALLKKSILMEVYLLYNPQKCSFEFVKNKYL